jgi:hypothetical protein
MRGQLWREYRFVEWLEQQPGNTQLVVEFRAMMASLPPTADWNERLRTMLGHDLNADFATDLIVELAAQLPEAPAPAAADGPPRLDGAE